MLGKKAGSLTLALALAVALLVGGVAQAAGNPVITVVSPPTPTAGSTTGADVTLSITTDIAANCYYTLDGTVHGFAVTGGTSHTKSLTGLADGSHTMRFYCENAGGASLGATVGVIYSWTVSAVPVPEACVTLTLSETSKHIDSPASNWNIDITAPDSTCTWGASSDAAWLTLGSDLGTGSGSLSVHAAANTGAARTGHLTIGGVTYTVTQDALPASNGTVTVTGVVTNDNGGTATLGDFTFHIGSTVVTSGTATDLAAGPYQVTVTGPTSGYTISYSGDCNASGNFNLSASDNLSCTVTLNDNASAPTTGHITVNGVVTNDNGGTSAVGDFTFKVGSTTVTSGTAANFDPGTYNVTVTGPTSGYSTSFSGDCNSSGSITLAASGNLTCTVTLNDNAPTSGGGGGSPTPVATLTVNRVVINDNGGSAVPADFPLSVGGVNVTNGSAVNFIPGTYQITQTGPLGGYTTSFSGDCTSSGQITMTAGNNYTCLITDNDIATVLTPISSPITNLPTSTGNTNNPTSNGTLANTSPTGGVSAGTSTNTGAVRGVSTAPTGGVAAGGNPAPTTWEGLLLFVMTAGLIATRKFVLENE